MRLARALHAHACPNDWSCLSSLSFRPPAELKGQQTKTRASRQAKGGRSGGRGTGRGAAVAYNTNTPAKKDSWTDRLSGQQIRGRLCFVAEGLQGAGSLKMIVFHTLVFASRSESVRVYEHLRNGIRGIILLGAATVPNFSGLRDLSDFAGRDSCPGLFTRFPKSFESNREQPRAIRKTPFPRKLNRRLPECFLVPPSS